MNRKRAIEIRLGGERGEEFRHELRDMSIGRQCYL